MSKFYKVLQGGHVDKSGRLVGVGEVVESDINLVERFPGCYEEATSGKPTKTVAKPSADEDEEDEEEDEKPAKVKKLGKDVSSSFPLAEEKELSVFRNGVNYFVAEQSNPGIALNDTPLVKAAVNKFLKKY